MKCSLLWEEIRSNYLYDKQNLDYLKYVLDNRFYYYGDHFKIDSDRKYKVVFKAYFLDFFVFILSQLQIVYNKKKVIFSNAYFNTDDELKRVFNCEVSRLPWKYNLNLSNRYDYKLYLKCKNFNKDFISGNLEYLLSKEFADRISFLKEDFRQFFKKNNTQSIFLPQDDGFFEKIVVSVAKGLGIKTVSVVHGLQFYLNPISWSTTDFLVVWGDLSKKDFVRNNFDKEKILVSGHPNYKNLQLSEILRFELNDILVITNSLNGARPYDDYTLTDRSNSIFYLKLIMKVLKSFSVNSARLRIHPSENIEFYRKNIDLSFFLLDTGDIKNSLKKSTLVIGPTSTVFFDALVSGINYVIFEYSMYEFGLNGYKIPSLYNGDNIKVPVAKNSSELEDIIRNKQLVDLSIINEICSAKFTLDELKNLV